MTTKQKMKLCWNCEGNVPRDEENCPYCGVYLGPSSISASGGQHNLFAPPYQAEEESIEEEIPPSPYATPPAYDPPEETEETEESKPENQKMGPFPMIALPTSLLLGGTILFLFGLMLVLFAKNGKFTLQWNSAYWYGYMILSLPMLFFGWLYLQKIEEN